MPTRKTQALSLLLPVLAPACTEVTSFANVDHCALNEGDRYCAEMFPDKPYCIQGQGECSIGDKFGCVAEVMPECHAPCGVLGEAECMAGSSSGTDSGSSSESGSGSESGGSESSSTTGPMPCLGNEDCGDAAAPFCEPVSGECVACDAFGAEADAACAELDPGVPLCVNGTCVACTPENPTVCDDQLLLCDGESNTCTQCTEHEQCGSGACELAMGKCFPGDFVVHVDADGGQDYTSVVLAVAAVDDGMHGVIVVHDRDDGLGYQGVTIDGGKAIALLAAQGETPVIQGSMGNPGLRVTGAGTVLYMDGMRLAGNTMGLGMDIDGSFAWVDRSRIVQNTGGGVLAQNAAELTLRNCFVTSSGNGISAIVLSDVDASILYSSMFSSAFAPTAAVGCAGTTTLALRNSIVVTEGGAPGDELGCVGGDVSYSATEALAAGSGNVGVGMFPDGNPSLWFADVTGGNLGLQNDGLTLFADIAQWNTGDPSTDIDGDSRPTVDGTADFAGADVP